MARTARSQTEIGMLLMTVAMLSLPGIDAIAKSMSGIVPPAEASLARFVVQTTVLFPFVLKFGLAIPRPMIGLHAARGALIAFGTMLFFTALRYLPMADAIAIFFVAPLLLTLLSPFMLNERVGWRRMTAVGVGFLGSLLVIQPSFEDAGWPALLPLATALCFAFYLILTRRLALTVDPIVMQFNAGIFGGLTSALALLLGWLTGWLPEVIHPVLPDFQALQLLLLLGLVATAGHMLVVHAFKRADAAVLAPFQYLEIISATLLGYLLFDDFPDALRWVGIGVIVASGLYVFYRERKVQAASSTP